jgi:hypothetical protein
MRRLWESTALCQLCLREHATQHVKIAGVAGSHYADAQFRQSDRLACLICAPCLARPSRVLNAKAPPQKLLLDNHPFFVYNPNDVW